MFRIFKKNKNNADAFRKRKVHRHRFLFSFAIDFVEFYKAQILRKISRFFIPKLYTIQRAKENAEVYQNMPLSVVAAATEDNYYSKNYDPSAVVIKDVAQAVVIHMFSLRELIAAFFVAA